MRQPCSVVVTGWREKNLGFMLESPKGFRMSYAITVALKR
jgi:hypothetical protein